MQARSKIQIDMKSAIINAGAGVAFLSFLPMIYIKFCVAGDADNFYDLCPADLANRKIFINGLPCKNPSSTKPSDFKSSLLSQAGDTQNFYRSSMIIATAADFPGLNTLGLSAARVDIDVSGIVAPHAHPRASEMIFVSGGAVVAGFLDSNDRVFQKDLSVGDVFVFPRGLLHYCYNAGFESATIFSVMNSQNPGLVSVLGAMFASRNVSVVKNTMNSVLGFDFNVPKVNSSFQFQWTR